MISARSSLVASVSPLLPAPSTVDRLRHLYRTSIAAVALLEAAGKRKARAWRETALSTARSEIQKATGSPTDSSVVIELFKKLHDIGVVQYVKGRAGSSQHRIRWLFWSPSVAAVAAEQASDFKPWGQSEKSRARRQARLARKRRSQKGEIGTGSPPAVEAAEVKKTRRGGSSAKVENPQVVLDLGGGVAVTWNRPHNPTPAEAEQFAKAVAGVVQSLGGVNA